MMSWRRDDEREERTVNRLTLFVIPRPWRRGGSVFPSLPLVRDTFPPSSCSQCRESKVKKETYRGKKKKEKNREQNSQTISGGKKIEQVAKGVIESRRALVFKQHTIFTLEITLLPLPLLRSQVFTFALRYRSLRSREISKRPHKHFAEPVSNLPLVVPIFRIHQEASSSDTSWYRPRAWITVRSFPLF